MFTNYHNTARSVDSFFASLAHPPAPLLSVRHVGIAGRGVVRGAFGQITLVPGMLGASKFVGRSFILYTQHHAADRTASPFLAMKLTPTTAVQLPQKEVGS